jgi:hypothetical protein
MGSDRTAGEVFRLLADDTRLDVLRTIAVAQHENRRTGVAGLAFSDIYERVDVDNTAKLSYHLGELTGVFLRKDDDGYAFTHAGEQLVRFVLAENYRTPPDVDPVETAGQCLFCGEAALVAAMHDQYFIIECADCDRPVFSYRVRPAQVRAHEGSDLIDAVIWEHAGDVIKMRQGVCPDCAGRMTTEVIDADEESMPAPVPISFGTVSECQQCLRMLSLPLPSAAAFHPESVAFHWEHGIDVLGTGMWECYEYLHERRWSAERTASGVGAYLVELDREATTLRLYLDESASVTRTERVKRRDQPDRRS